MKLKFISQKSMSALAQLAAGDSDKTALFADALRLNTLSMIQETGSGHIGSSFSSMDILTWLWTHELERPNTPDGDVFFSSKGHDVPALYSVLSAFEVIDFEKIHQLRRLNGLPGHPDVRIRGIAANTGSLGMGISKARGMALANRLHNKNRRIIVMLGDGELQEGQIWESLQPTKNGKYSEITAIVDHNKIQSDGWVKDTSDLGAIEDRFRSFGWHVERCDGHSLETIKNKLELCRSIKDGPQVIIADTVKGKGVSFMEAKDSEGPMEHYNYHSGALSEDRYYLACEELISRISALAEQAEIVIEYQESEKPTVQPTLDMQEKLVAAYGDELLKIGEANKEVVVLDGDLAYDCSVLPFKKALPERYVECGIAEQDMVSMASGLALEGMVPIVHSFACFLSTRPNEQIYNNATERKKIVYVGSLAGLIPAAPGHSHQSLRDVSTLGSIPGLTLLEPCNEAEARQAIRWAIEENHESTYIRLVSVPSKLDYALPKDYSLVKGRGVKLKSGGKIAIFGYGPVLLKEAFEAAEILAEEGVDVTICNFPWLNYFDRDWLKREVKDYDRIITLDDHYTDLGQNAFLREALIEVGWFTGKSEGSMVSLGIKEIPECGQRDEILRYHKLDAHSIADVILAK